MGRKGTPTKPEAAPAINEQVVGADLRAADQITQQMALVAEQFGEGLPYDRERIVHEARFYMAQSAETMLEAGKRLVLIKEHEPHGDFLQIVESRLGLSVRTAQVMMQAAVKFLSPALAPNAQALAHLGKTKLLELVAEDDDQLAGLAAGGTIAGLSLDEIDSMTTRELRAALREAKEDQAAQERLLAEKNAKIDQLASKKKPKAPPWPEQIAELKGEIGDIGSVVDECFGKHAMFVAAAESMIDQLAEQQGPNFDAAKSCVHRLGEQIERMCTLAATVRHEFDTRLAGYIAGDKSNILPDEA